MADYYTSCSFVVAVPREAAEYAWRINDILSEGGGPVSGDNPYPPDTAEFAAFEIKRDEGADYFGSGCEFSIEEDGSLWVHSEESAEIGLVAEIMQKTMKRFNIDGTITIQWAATCSKPRIDAYGGGVVVVNKDTTESWNSFDAAVELERRLAPMVMRIT